MFNSTHASALDNNAILQRLDREHATAFETACKLAKAAVEADGGDFMTLPDDWQPSDYVQTPAGDEAEKASHAAWLAFEALGNAAACFREPRRAKASRARRESSGAKLKACRRTKSSRKLSR
jgi:hypothetical protein